MIRLKEVVYSLEDIKRKVLNLGYCGDKGVLEIKFDCSEFFKDKETKNAKLLLIKPDDTNSAIDLTVADGMASLSVDDGITDVVGFGEYQLKLDDGTNVFHSAKGRYRVGKVIDDPTPPAPTSLVGRTFEFNNNISLDIDSEHTVYDILSINQETEQLIYNILFTTPLSSDTEFYGMEINKENGIIDYVSTNGPMSVYVAQGGWFDSNYKTIKFVNDVTPVDLPAPDFMHVVTKDEMFAWLAENATDITE